AEPRKTSAADPPAQLMQLRQPEALGPVDDHERRVGDVDADFNNGGGYEDLRFSFAKDLHRRALGRALELPMYEPQPEVAQVRLRKTLEDRLGAGPLGNIRELAGAADPRADDESLPSRAELLPHEVPDFLASGADGDSAGVHLLPSRRQIGHDRKI